MPELPEVETIRRAIATAVTGRQIKEVRLDLPRLVKKPSPEQFVRALRGAHIEQVERRGKYLLFLLDNGYTLVIHLRMTGRLYHMPSSEPSDRFTHVVLELDDGWQLRYSDVRTLGTLYLVWPEEICQIKGLHCLGPEPLSQEFNPDYLERALLRSKSKIKAVLLNQEIIAGLGNIYVDESLAIAHIHPERIANSLLKQEIAKLYAAIVQSLTEGIDHGGTSFRDYRNAGGKPGDHQHYLYVYGRKNQPCRFCGQPIQKTVVAGRGTHFCDKCQT